MNNTESGVAESELDHGLAVFLVVAAAICLTLMCWMGLRELTNQKTELAAAVPERPRRSRSQHNLSFVV